MDGILLAKILLGVLINVAFAAAKATYYSVTRAWTITPQTTGSVTVVDVTTTGIVVDFNFRQLGSEHRSPGNTAQGFFDTSGRVSAKFAPTLS